MPISDLPHDVLEAITMDLEPSEVASMAAASRACYEAVMPLLLESIRIHSDPIQPTMENALALISLLGRRVDFASSVKTLELRGDFDRNESSQRAFTAFCGISASLVRLSTLYLRDASTLFINNHAVLRALAHHASLRTVHFDLGQYSGKPEDATFLEINSVPLTNITLSWGYHQKIYSGRTWISLSRVQYSLETLDLRKATIDVPSEDAKVWPNLISLSLHSCTIPVRLISTCFPQLRMLNLWEVEVTKDLISPGNISASAHPLSSLSTLQTDLLSAKRLVAELKTSLIPSLVVSTAINDHMVPDDLGTLLTHVPPVVLEISFVVPFKNVLKGVLDIGPLRQTIVLYISIHIPQVSSSEDIDDTLDLLVHDHLLAYWCKLTMSCPTRKTLFLRSWLLLPRLDIFI